MSNATFVVHGGFIGKYSTGGTASTHKDGTYTGQGTTTLTYNPGLNFKPGELVSVTLTTGLQNGGGQALVAAKVVQFRAAAGAGPGVFSAGSDVEAGVTLNTARTEVGDLDGDGDLDLITGNNATLTAAATAADSYQWKHWHDGNATWSNIGGNSASLALTNIQLEDAGKYELTLTLPEDQNANDRQTIFRNRSFAGHSIASASAQPISILLFLSMLPLHHDHPARQRAFLANALRLFVDLDE